MGTRINVVSDFPFATQRKHEEGSKRCKVDSKPSKQSTFGTNKFGQRK